MTILDVGWDLDGVIHDFCEDLRRAAIQKGYDPARVAGAGNDDPTTVWNFPTTHWGMDLDEFLELCNWAADHADLFNGHPPIPGAIEAMREVAAMGHRNHIVTDRDFGSKSHHNTSDWLRENEVPHDSLTFTRHKTVVCKGMDVVIDDRDKNFDELWEAGIRCYLLDRPWNRHVDAGKFRLFGLEEYVSEIKVVADRRERLMA